MAVPSIHSRISPQEREAPFSPSPPEEFLDGSVPPPLSRIRVRQEEISPAPIPIPPLRTMQWMARISPSARIRRETRTTTTVRMSHVLLQEREAPFSLFLREALPPGLRHPPSHISMQTTPSPVRTPLPIP